MSKFTPLRELETQAEYTDKDVLVVFGEVFSRGYVNGIIDMAKAKGMKVIYSTVGRRDENMNLKALRPEDIAAKDSLLINIPLEAGFDLETSSQGKSPVDQLQGVRLKEWDQVKLDWDQITESRASGTERFRASVKKYLDELLPQVPTESNVLFVHTMAGGFPRSKIVMPLANKVFKGFDKRFMSSKVFWDSEIGKLCEQSFSDVTGETLHHLIDLTSALREQKSKKGLQVNYVAYGYHGTETLHNDEYKWQSYSPYLQGWAKVHLENRAQRHFDNGVNVSIYNCPEILTNSSSIFLGVEVALYPLLGALQKEQGDNDKVKDLFKNCTAKLKKEHSIKEILQVTNDYLTSSVFLASHDFATWPQHNNNEQMKLMRTTSSQLIEMHKDTKNLITTDLSEVVFKTCGYSMFHQSWKKQQPVWWLGHDVLAKTAHLI